MNSKYSNAFEAIQRTKQIKIRHLYRRPHSIHSLDSLPSYFTSVSHRTNITLRDSNVTRCVIELDNCNLAVFPISPLSTLQRIRRNCTFRFDSFSALNFSSSTIEVTNCSSFNCLFNLTNY